MKHIKITNFSITFLRIFAYTLLTFSTIIVSLLIILCFSILSTERMSLESSIPPTGRHIQTQYGKVFIRELGPKTGRPILFTHGVGGSGGLWHKNTELLAKRGYYTITIDLPPFGFSERSTKVQYSRRQQAEQILTIIEKLKLHDVIMVGHSFGSGASVEATMLAPEHVSQLVLVDSALGIQSTPNNAPSPLLGIVFSVPAFRNLITASTFTNPLATQYLLEQMIYNHSAVNKANIQTLQDPLVVQGSTASLAVWMKNFLTSTERPVSSIPASYKKLSLPIVIIWGEKDTVTPLSDARYLQTLMPHAKLFVLNDVGHIPYIEDSNALDDVFGKQLLPSSFRD